MRKIRCPVCKEERETKSGDYLYLESGLDNVWLCGVEILRCSCGESPLIPHPLALHDAIAHCVLTQKASLGGKEIRFLRKRMAIKALEFAKLLGVDNATVSRWEHDKDKPSDQADRLIRLLYANRMGLQKEAEELAKSIFPDISPSLSKPPFHVMADKLGRFSCTPACR